MQNHLVFTVIAKDRAGLVERISACIAALGGNWIESSMARLGGEFAGIVRVAIAADQADALVASLQDLSADGIDITLRSDRAGQEAQNGTSAHLDLVSQDHPGILRDITHVLTAQGVSIEHLTTEVVAGSMQGEALFKASADLRLPETLSPGALSDALQETAADLMADINLVD
ncbi:amino acid-binding protein [Roseibium denhamense]|uniref:Glycine cleavage system regulatory protein n=1 Tax=Roseibium denhamense TaxID=76305 RepID=A0ABY1PIU7_9HYPH|nr:ACT domain-containing protein [Roseibium denhamense]MTI05583.1 amino acid-binding protein [Roseibium denhamense]SMP34637.1 Glycine cleavage system regulatory protein [Roseibium denhamense]